MSDDVVERLMEYCEANFDQGESVYRALCESRQRTVHLPEVGVTLTLAQIWEFAEAYQKMIEPTLRDKDYR